MIKKIREFPFHPFLFCIYLVLFIYVQNIAEVTFPMTYRTIVISLAFTAIIYGINYLIFRDRKKTGLISTLLIIAFFSYGAFYMRLEHLYYQGFFPFYNIHRYLIVFCVTLYTLLYFYVCRSKRTFEKSNFFLNIFVLVLISINLVTIGYTHFFKNEIIEAEGNPFIKKYKNEIHKGITDKSLPDVYYIVLDGYAREDVLKKYYHFDNSDFINFLRAKGFYIADSSKTNYPYTNQSLASSLNLSYIDSISENRSLIPQNFVSYFFKARNYRIVNLESGYAVTKNFEYTDAQHLNGGVNEFERSILKLTVLRLDDLLGISTYVTIKGVLKELYDVSNEPSPKYSFIHIVSPHPPYIFRKDGSFHTHKALSRFSWEPREDYIEQLKYINSEIKTYLDKITSKPGVKPIIVLQSDHGPWIVDRNENNVYESRSGILNAYMVPEQWKKDLYPGISPVNSFRVILNNLFKVQMPLVQNMPADKEKLMKNVTFRKFNEDH